MTATYGARNIELVKNLGADKVLNYKTPDVVALRSPSGIKYERSYSPCNEHSLVVYF